MSALTMIVGGWLGLNAAVFAALMLRRSRPEVRERLFKWAIGAPRRPLHVGRRWSHSRR
jgi:hypothetical protein